MPDLTNRIELPGGVIVDFRREEVRGPGGMRIELRPRSFGVLRCLVAEAGKLVTKDKLLADCWPGVIVTEDSLTQCISDIRRALGAGGRDLIRTVARRGYVLVLPEIQPDPVVTETALPAALPSYWPSIAVLPFDEFGSGEPGGFGALGAGFAEDLTTELARNRGLPITARHNVFAAKAQGRSPTEVAALFGARFVLEGSIRPAGERMLINAQLIDGTDGRHVWAERYSVLASALATDQDDLVGRIASAVLGEIRLSGYAASLRQAPETTGVQELAWQALAHLRQHSRDSYLAAYAELERAVALGPTYALAHCVRGLLVACDAGMAISGTVGPHALSEAIEIARQGLSLDPLLPVGYQGLCLAHLFSGRFEEALLAAERCVAYGPGDALNLFFLSMGRAGIGQYAEALADAEQAMALNPVFPANLYGVTAIPLYALDRFEEASRYCTVSTERCPGYTFGYVLGAAADAALGRKETAAGRVATVLRRAPWITAQWPAFDHLYRRDPPLRARFLRHMRQAGVPGVQD